MFGGAPTTTPAPVFGAGAPAQKPLFGGAIAPATAGALPAFGGAQPTTAPTLNLGGAPATGGAQPGTTATPTLTLGGQTQPPPAVQDAPQKPMILKSFRLVMSKVQSFLQTFNIKGLVRAHLFSFRMNSSGKRPTETSSRTCASASSTSNRRRTTSQSASSSMTPLALLNGEARTSSHSASRRTSW